MAVLRNERQAFGKPGIAPRWTRSDKHGVGTAYSAASRVWFTISAGILNEVYYPTIDRPQIRDLVYQPIMEDVELSLRLRCLGTPIYLDLPVTVSARRIVRKKWWRVVWQNFLIRRSYRRNGLAVCAQLHERYYRDS